MYSLRFKPLVRLAAAFGLAACLDVASQANAAFGITTTTDLYTVDTGAGLVFSVRRTDPSNNTQAAGDISSMKFNGVEYQDQTRGSQIGVGLGSASVSATTYGSSYIKITVNDGNGLTHYYMARNGYPYIYMGTYFTSEPSLGNVRYIVRIPYSLLSNGPVPSNINGNTGAIESSDIFGMSDGTTRSKHYSNHRQMDWTYTGATGSGVGVWMVKNNAEGMSGGPFYRCLINQAGSDQEIYELINYGEAQTEANRTGILNLYTLVFTGGGTPPGSIDTSWMSGLGLTGYVGSSGRGTVAGVGIAGRNTSYQYVVGFANSQAQYWTTARSSDGYFSCGGMLPGTYNMTIYKGEMAVWTGSATVTAGQTSVFHTITVTADPSFTSTIWRIGDWDGAPTELLNGDKITYMHPSDSRISTWKPSNFIVGTSPSSQLPCYFWKNVNDGYIIYFRLNSTQAASAHTLRIGLTCAYAGGRIMPSVNSWTASIPSAPNEPSTRTLTVGTYRGNNVTYSFTVPASAWQSDTSQWNVLKLTVVSGSSGSGYLNPGCSLDCVELDN